MNAPIDTGGPAFPWPSGPEPRVDQFHDRWEGMTLRDYFIAHAPAEPWPEFDPVMPPKPVLPNKHTLLSDADRKDWDDDRLDYDEEGCSDALKQFCSDTVSARKAQEEWGADRNLQRRLQWPAYWADQMIAQRNKR